MKDKTLKKYLKFIMKVLKIHPLFNNKVLLKNQLTQFLSLNKINLLLLRKISLTVRAK